MSDDGSRLRADLDELLAETPGDRLLVVVVALTDDPTSLAPETAVRDLLVDRRRGFDEWSAPVDAHARALEARVVGRAWLNASLKVVVPAGRVAELASHERIRSVGLPIKI